MPFDPRQPNQPVVTVGNDPLLPYSRQLTSGNPSILNFIDGGAQSTLQAMISSIGINTFGNGSNGALVLATSQSASATVTTADSGVTVLQYSSITLGASSNFTASTRTQALWIYCQGNCSIGTGATLTMTARGASAVCNSNMNVTKFVAGDTTYVSTEAQQSGSATYTSAQVGGSGGSGGNGTAGSTGLTTTNGTGGGGGGASQGNGGVGGNGSAGTAFSGGSGGGGGSYSGGGTSGANGGANGGAGGNAGASTSSQCAGGGAGNPGGTATTGSGNSSTNGSSGTAGTIILIVGGTLSGTGTIQSNGSAGGTATNSGGGASGGGGSGGGRVIVLSTSGSLSGGTLQASGGAAGAATGSGVTNSGGTGGAGSISTGLIANPQLLANNISAISSTATPLVGATSLLNTSPTLIEFNASAGSFNINLPPSTIARQFIFYNVASTTNIATLVPNGSDNIVGGSSYALPNNIVINGSTITSQYSTTTLTSDGLGNWTVS